jgi:hypothetical protein
MAVLEQQLKDHKAQLTPEQEHELHLCEQSFTWFLPYWTFVNRETGELETFKELWDGQRDFVEAMETHPWIFALKAGKLGFTELECAYDGWVLRFKKNARVHVFSRDAAAAEELLGYVKLGLNHFPKWMRLDVDSGRGADIDRSLRLYAGEDDVRAIVRYAAGASVSIDQTATHSHVDELARMPYTEQTWTAVETTISPTGGTCHIVTRGAGNANYSADLWHKALAGDGNLHPFFSDWTKRPRPEGFYEETKASMTPLGLKEYCPESWEDAIGGPGQDAVFPLSWIEGALEAA